MSDHDPLKSIRRRLEYELDAVLFSQCETLDLKSVLRSIVKEYGHVTIEAPIGSSLANLHAMTSMCPGLVFVRNDKPITAPPSKG